MLGSFNSTFLYPNPVTSFFHIGYWGSEGGGSYNRYYWQDSIYTLSSIRKR
jgi:hypothetical protein